MRKKKEYYFVPYGWGYQHGTDIIPVSEEEYKSRKYKNHGVYFDNYRAALYYTMD